MNQPFFSRIRKISLAVAFLSSAVSIHGQTDRDAGTIEGKVCDPENQPVASAGVVLEAVGPGQPLSTSTDSQGRFRFSKIASGTYRLRVNRSDFAEAVEGPFSTSEKGTTSLVVRLQRANSDTSRGKATTEIPFSNETHFTVAGVMDTTSLGGHGSDPVRRNSDELSRDAAKLTNSDSPANGGTADETRLRQQLSKQDSADLRFRLAEIEEKSGHPLEAANDYQRAAEMEPTEPHLFTWGAELLLHRAFDPSIEVFTMGRGLYPNSVRMVLGLASATYGRGSTEQAMQIFLDACDLVPSDETPYLFLGRVQQTENELPSGWADRLKRFAGLRPDNALAHYYYAVALIKESSDPSIVRQAESQLKDAIRLDPQLGDAYLEMGILAAQRGDTAEAITQLKRAIANTPLPDNAHYWLAQVYRRMGEIDKAREESELYKEISEQKRQQVERERHELQQFVYTLHEQKPASQSTLAPK